MSAKPLIRPVFNRSAVLPALALLAPLLAAPLAAQPTFVGVETGENGEGPTSLTIDVPSGAVGDLLLAVIGVEVNPSTPTPTGWTAVPGFTGFNDAICASGDGVGIRCQLSAFYKFAASASEGSVTWVFGPNPRSATGAILRYANTDPTSPIGPTNDQNGTGTSVNVPSIVTVENDSLVLRVALADSSQSKAKLTGGPATERFNEDSRTSAADTESVSIAGADFVQGTAGATSTASWTSGESEQWVAGNIVIRPVPTVVDVDLAVAKDDDPDKVNPGGSLDYTLTVSNNGPNDATGATVTDVFDVALTCTWTCSAAGASSCGAAAGSGNISETVDVAVGDDVTFDVSCSVDGGASGSVPNTASVAAADGFNDTDSGNDSASTSTPVNQAPVAVCQDVELEADQVSCLADVASSEAFDGGSSDPDGDLPLSFSHTPVGPYSLGDTAVTLTVEDALGLTDSCGATVTVVDVSAPVIECNASGTIVPPDAPISFTATATDACGPATAEILGYDCFKFTKKGKRVDKTESCEVSIAGDTITIEDTGGKGTRITWVVEATDGSGNMIEMDCGTEVVNPGKGKGLSAASKVERGRKARRAGRSPR